MAFSWHSKSIIQRRCGCQTRGCASTLGYCSQFSSVTHEKATDISVPHAGFPLHYPSPWYSISPLNKELEGVSIQIGSQRSATADWDMSNMVAESNKDKPISRHVKKYKEASRAIGWHYLDRSILFQSHQLFIFSDSLHHSCMTRPLCPCDSAGLTHPSPMKKP